MTKKAMLESCGEAMKATAAANEKNTAEAHNEAASHHRIAAEHAKLMGDDALHAKHKDMAVEHDLAEARCLAAASNNVKPKDEAAATAALASRSFNGRALNAKTSENAPEDVHCARCNKDFSIEDCTRVDADHVKCPGCESTLNVSANIAENEDTKKQAEAARALFVKAVGLEAAKGHDEYMSAMNCAHEATETAHETGYKTDHKIAAAKHDIAQVAASRVGMSAHAEIHGSMAEHHREENPKAGDVDGYEEALQACHEDPGIWSKAKAAAEKGDYVGDTLYQVANKIYENMGGETKSARAYRGRLNELSSARMSFDKPLMAALSDDGWDVEDLKSRIAEQIADLDEFKSKNGNMGPSGWVATVIIPEHEEGETWTAVVPGNDGKLYAVEFKIEDDDVEVVGDPKQIERTSDYEYVDDMENEAKRFAKVEALEATWSDAVRAAARLARQSGAKSGTTAWDKLHAMKGKDEAAAGQDEMDPHRASQGAYKASEYAEHATRTANESNTSEDHSNAAAAHRNAEHAHDYAKDATNGEHHTVLANHHAEMVTEHENKARSLPPFKRSEKIPNLPRHASRGNADTSSLQAAVLVHVCHDELRASGCNPDLNAVRHEVLRLHGVDLTCTQVGDFLSRPVEAIGKAAGDPNKPLESSGAALESGKTDDLRSLATTESVIMYMPGGVHTITPSQGGKPVTVTVKIDEVSAERMEEQRAALEAGGNKPFFSVQHNTQIAAFWPTKFFWDTRLDATGSLVSGVWAEGEWTQAGREAVEGKNFRTFSPTFFVDAIRNDPEDPVEVACNVDAKLNMGALENDPAFESISPLWAKRASSKERKHEMEAEKAVKKSLKTLVSAGRNPNLAMVRDEVKRSFGLSMTEDEVCDYL
ncbi:MAG: hypothetical protein KGL39_03040 [Patescibacteria group bacterium]|nr:hypothetical protein [Patescibacteria group bacterium]